MIDVTSGRKIEKSPRVVIDGGYLRSQALDAVRLFISPLYGVYAAATGMKATVTAESSKKKRQTEQHLGTD